MPESMAGVCYALSLGGPVGDVIRNRESCGRFRSRSWIIGRRDSISAVSLLSFVQSCICSSSVVTVCMWTHPSPRAAQGDELVLSCPKSKTTHGTWHYACDPEARMHLSAKGFGSDPEAIYGGQQC
jgi:hypothetical protein